MLGEGAKVLYKITNKTVLFGNITITVPSSWNSERYAIGVPAHTPLIHISPPNLLYGNVPYTQQPGNCGERGLFIHLTPQYLLNMEKNLTVQRIGLPGSCIHES